MRFLVPVVIAAAFAACSTRTVSERERALEAIPAGAHVIFAADGPALATPAVRAALDSLTPHVPPSFACVVEASQTSRQVAVGATSDSGITIVLLTRAAVGTCPALSRIGETIYVATIGGGALAADRAHSMLAAPAWDRARPYLLQEPLALGAELADLRMVAAAQPDPVDGWLAIDAVDSDAIAKQVQTVLDRYAAQSSELAAKLKLSRTGSQVRVDAAHLSVDDLARVATGLARALEAPAPAATASFVCPQPGDGVIACHGGTLYSVKSVSALVRAIGTRRSTPVIGAGDIVGLRLLDDAPPLLRAQDIILGIDSHRIESAAQLAQLADTLGTRTSIAVRRDGRDTILDLSQ